MAVNINIPGFGTVTADNAATESTLQALVSAVRAQQSVAKANTDAINETNANQQRSAQSTAAALGAVASSANRANSSVTAFSRDVSDSLKETQATVRQTTSFLQRLAQSTVNMAQQLTADTSFASQNPIKQAQKNMQTAFDLLADGATTLFSFLPIGKAAKAAKAAKGGKGGTGANVAKDGKTSSAIQDTLNTVNAIVGGELEKTIDVFEMFNQAGATFSLGMTHIREVSARAGVEIGQFARGIRQSLDSIKTFGLTTAGGTEKLAKLMEGLDKQEAVGEAGLSLRESLRTLGYGIEDQIKLGADYLAQLRNTMTMEQFRQLNAEAVARRTHEYGKSLKLLSDLTGASAEAISAEARQRSISAVALTTLEGEQRQRFGVLTGALRESGQDVLVRAIEQKLATGVVTDETFNKMAAQDDQLLVVLDQLIAQIQSSGMSDAEFAQTTMGIIGDYTEGLRGRLDDTGLREIVAASVATGAQADMISFFEGLNKFKFTGEDAENSRKTIENLSQGSDQLTNTAIKTQETLNKLSVTLQTALTPALEPYTKLLLYTNEKFVSAIDGIVGLMEGLLSMFGIASDHLNNIQDAVSNMGVDMGQNRENSEKLPEANPINMEPMVQVDKNLQNDMVQNKILQDVAKIKEARQVAEAQTQQVNEELVNRLIDRGMTREEVSEYINGIKQDQKDRDNKIIGLLEEHLEQQKKMVRNTGNAVDIADRNYSWNT